MTNPIDDQILALIKTKLAAISVAGGYQTNMAAGRVHYPAVGELEFSADELTTGPQVMIRRAARTSRMHLRAAEEFTLKVDIKWTCATRDKAAELMGDLMKLIAANPIWNNGSTNLAAKTWIEETDLQDFDVEADQYVGQMVLCVKGYSDVTAPGTVKVI